MKTTKTKHKKGCLLTVLCAFTLLQAQGAEYFVSLQGNDNHDGSNSEKAFSTIQKGVDALKPGDTLTIGPGEYFENVALIDFGDIDKETRIRAQIPGTVLLRGDRNADVKFSKVPGKKFVYVSNCESDVLSVMEADTYKPLVAAAHMEMLEFGPGRYFHDAENKKLYVSSSDLKSPNQHLYSLGTLKEDGFLGLGIKRVVFEGLAASGFRTPGDRFKSRLSRPVSGFLLMRSKNCIVRNCVAYLNKGGIIFNDTGDASPANKSRGGDNIVEYCQTYGNASEGICIYDPSHGTVRDCRIFLNYIHGGRFYGKRHGDEPCIFLRNLAWGNGGADFWFKGTGLSADKEYARAEQCIAFKSVHIGSFKQGIQGRRIYYDGDKSGTILMPDNRAGFLKESDREFADPLNFDFRLQSNSQFRKQGEKGADKGPYAYKANVFHVKSNGDDRNDGLSMEQAWKSLGHALKSLKRGDTLYLSAGSYRGEAEKPITLEGVSIRARAHDKVVIAGGIKLLECKDFAMERIHLASPVTIKGGQNISISNCVFTGSSAIKADGVRGLKVSHGLFASSIRLDACDAVALTGNVYLSGPAVKIASAGQRIDSSYNSYSEEAVCWELAGQPVSLSGLRKLGHDRYSILGAFDIDADDDLVSLEAAINTGGRGPLGSAIGPYLEWKEVEVSPISGPFLHSVDDTSANLEWWTSLPSEVSLSWGDTPECVNKVRVNQQSYFSHSLTGLKPNTKYFVQLMPRNILANADSAYRYKIPEKKTNFFQFTTTAEAAKPFVTYYVATNGDDGKSGRDRQNAWSSLQHAADKVKPGDTVLIAGGQYPGGVYFRTSGTADRPITFKAAPGQKVLIKGDGGRGRLHAGLIIYGKNYYDFDGFYLEGFAGIADNVAGAEVGAFLIKGGANININRCHMSKGWGQCVVAKEVKNLRITNSVMMHSMSASMFTNCQDLVVENNVFVSPLIKHIYVFSGSTYRRTIRNNIFGENTRGKVGVSPISIGNEESNNCFYIRWPVEERKLYGDLTILEHRARFPDADSIVANPGFVDAQGWKQGWGGGAPNKDFIGLFATNPELIKRGIGLQPEVFKDFHFWKEDWPYTQAWAEKMAGEIEATQKFFKLGDDEKALQAFLAISKRKTIENRMLADVLDRAALCADRLGKYDQAIEIAEAIPFKVLSARRQAMLMSKHGKYQELIDKFSDTHTPPKGRKVIRGVPYLTWPCPETEMPMVEFYGYRGFAYARTGRLEEAEADLRIMIEKRDKLKFSSGEMIMDTAHKQLGDFYRHYLKNDAKALSSYMAVIKRTTLDVRSRVVPKPALTGNYKVLAEATGAAVEILEKQGKLDKAREVTFSLLKAQAKAHQALKQNKEAVVKYREALAIKGVPAEGRDECEKAIKKIESAS